MWSLRGEETPQHFVAPGSSTEEYIKSIISNILMEGACCVCLRCKVEEGFEQKCAFCGVEKAQSEFVPRSDTAAKWRCKECANPRCTDPDCTTCKVCRDPVCKTTVNCSKPLQPLPTPLLPKTMAEIMQYKCAGCHDMKCDKCKLTKKRSHFTDWEEKQLRNKKSMLRPVCKECT